MCGDNLWSFLLHDTFWLHCVAWYLKLKDLRNMWWNHLSPHDKLHHCGSRRKRARELWKTQPHNIKWFDWSGSCCWWQHVRLVLVRDNCLHDQDDGENLFPGVCFTYSVSSWGRNSFCDCQRSVRLVQSKQPAAGGGQRFEERTERNKGSNRTDHKARWGITQAK